MILLDTNVVSEAMKPTPNPAVLAWLDAQAAETLYISSVTIAELLFSIGALPVGKRKDRLAVALDNTLQIFANRILTFDTMAAWSYADLAVKAQKVKKSFAVPDAYIASIAAAHGLTVATRFAGPFETAQVPVIDPWAAGK